MSKKRFEVTAIIYDKRGNVLSIGKNSYIKTHPLQAKYAKQVGEDHKVFLHAEIHAITRCSELEKAHRIAVFRYNEAGLAVSAKPCKICQAAISKTNIKVVEHT
jgi:tRNA(Arg) A34 adenosine deaminase TadA